MSLYEQLQRLLQQLDEDQVDYALVGALAVAIWGAPRATRVIDLLILPKSLPAALASARRCGFGMEALPMDFKDGTTVQRVNKVDASGDLLTLDFLLVNDNLRPIWDTRSRMSLSDTSVSVISRDALIEMKAAAARPQDLMDIQNLQDIDR